MRVLQSKTKRSIIPKIHPVMSFKEAGCPTAGHAICVSCPMKTNGVCRQPRRRWKKLFREHPVSVLIQPEGGFADEEIEAVRCDMEVLSLGKRILRTYTAAICTMSMLMLKLEQKIL